MYIKEYCLEETLNEVTATLLMLCAVFKDLIRNEKLQYKNTSNIWTLRYYNLFCSRYFFLKPAIIALSEQGTDHQRSRWWSLYFSSDMRKLTYV